jgi:hypothetical protein
MSERFWKALENGAQLTRNFIDELWKIWRWFGIGILGFRTYDVTGSIQALIFGVAMTTIGLVALASWIFGKLVPGVTLKGRASRALVSVILGMAMLLISIVFAFQLWAIVALLALPVFSAQ